jgi:hypothetical protein
MHSSNYLFFTCVIAPNFHQNLSRKMLGFGIPVLIATGIPVSSIKSTGIKILTGIVSPRFNLPVSHKVDLLADGVAAFPGAK